jgi:hypothetical protein
VSAWNDNGAAELVSEDAAAAVSQLHRTDFFPGLGRNSGKSGIFSFYPIIFPTFSFIGLFFRFFILSD